MAHKITLPVCGLEVELKAWSWEDSKTFFARAAEFVKNGGTAEDWMELCLRADYPDTVLNVALKAAPDAVALYNDTLRYNKSGADFVKNSSRSGPGEQTQTA